MKGCFSGKFLFACVLVSQVSASHCPLPPVLPAPSAIQLLSPLCLDRHHSCSQQRHRNVRSLQTHVYISKTSNKVLGSLAAFLVLHCFDYCITIFLNCLNLSLGQAPSCPLSVIQQGPSLGDHSSGRLYCQSGSASDLSDAGLAAFPVS